MSPHSTALRSTDSVTAECNPCKTSPTCCAPGIWWTADCGPCIRCGRESTTSAACGHPHCVDCRNDPHPPRPSGYTVRSSEREGGTCWIPDAKASQ